MSYGGVDDLSYGGAFLQTPNPQAQEPRGGNKPGLNRENNGRKRKMASRNSRTIE